MARTGKTIAWVIGAPAVLVGAFALKTLADPAARDRMAARSACERRIELHALNPRNVRIRTVRPLPEGELLVSRWTPDTLQFQNAFGAMVGAYVTCAYDPRTGAVVRFELD